MIPTATREVLIGTAPCVICAETGVGCPVCKGKGFVTIDRSAPATTTRPEPTAGRYTFDESKVTAHYAPHPCPVGQPARDSRRAIEEGRTVRLQLVPGKVGRLSPRHARRLAAELLTAAAEAEVKGVRS